MLSVHAFQRMTHPLSICMGQNKGCSKIPLYTSVNIKLVAGGVSWQVSQSTPA